MYSIITRSILLLQGYDEMRSNGKLPSIIPYWCDALFLRVKSKATCHGPWVWARLLLLHWHAKHTKCQLLLLLQSQWKMVIQIATHKTHWAPNSNHLKEIVWFSLHDSHCAYYHHPFHDQTCEGIISQGEVAPQISWQNQQAPDDKSTDALLKAMDTSKSPQQVEKVLGLGVPGLLVPETTGPNWQLVPGTTGPRGQLVPRHYWAHKLVPNINILPWKH